MVIQQFFCDFTRVNRWRLTVNGSVVGVYLTKGDALRAFNRYFSEEVVR